MLVYVGLIWLSWVLLVVWLYLVFLVFILLVLIGFIGFVRRIMLSVVPVDFICFIGLMLVRLGVLWCWCCLVPFGFIGSIRVYLYCLVLFGFSRPCSGLLVSLIFVGLCWCSLVFVGRIRLYSRPYGPRLFHWVSLVFVGVVGCVAVCRCWYCCYLFLVWFHSVVFIFVYVVFFRVRVWYRAHVFAWLYWLPIGFVLLYLVFVGGMWRSLFPFWFCRLYWCLLVLFSFAGGLFGLLVFMRDWLFWFGLIGLVVLVCLWFYACFMLVLF